MCRRRPKFFKLNLKHETTVTHGLAPRGVWLILRGVQNWIVRGCISRDPARAKVAHQPNNAAGDCNADDSNDL